jgi:hypothetical protein
MILSTDIQYDATGIASDLAGEARYALGQGDTKLAAEKYAEAPDDSQDYCPKD